MNVVAAAPTTTPKPESLVSLAGAIGVRLGILRDDLAQCRELDRDWRLLHPGPGLPCDERLECADLAQQTIECGALGGRIVPVDVERSLDARAGEHRDASTPCGLVDG